jgi:hypothetical protein
MYWLNFLKYMFFFYSLMLFECFEFNKDVPITVLFFWIWKMKIATFCRMTHISLSTKFCWRKHDNCDCEFADLCLSHGVVDWNVQQCKAYIKILFVWCWPLIHHEKCRPNYFFGQNSLISLFPCPNIKIVTEINVREDCHLFGFFCTKKNNKVTGMTNKTTRSYIMT